MKMWECSYGDEPADRKLFWLLFIRKVKWILGAALIGAALGSGIYYLVNHVFSPATDYSVKGEVYVDYQVVDGYGISLTAYNAETWNTMFQSDEFINRILTSVNEQGFSVKEDLVKESILAELISDSRLLITTVTMKDSDLAVAVSHGLLNAILTFGEGEDGVKEIRVMSDPQTAVLEKRKSKIVSAAFTGAVLLAFVVACTVMLMITIDDSVYIPSSFEKRYHLTSLETITSPGLTADLSYLLKGVGKVAVISLNKQIPIEEVSEKLSSIYKGAEFIPFMNVEGPPALTDEVRNLDTCILVGRYGNHDGKQMEKTIAFLKRQDLQITGALLWGADEKLLSRYYGKKGNQA